MWKKKAGYVMLFGVGMAMVMLAGTEVLAQRVGGEGGSTRRSLAGMFGIATFSDVIGFFDMLCN